MGYCPECDAPIDEEFDDVGEIITCPECGVDLEVISLDPVEFDLAPVDDEDEEEDEEDFNFDDEDEDEEDWDDDDEEALDEEEDEYN